MIRKTASKEKIKQAFIVLLETEGFQKMTISSLVKQAGINRGTFYLNYLDKDDLAQQLVNDFFTDIAAILKQDNGDRNDWFSPAAISQIIEYVQNNFAFAHALLNSDLKGQVKELLSQILAQAFLHQHANLQQPKIKQPYASEIVFGGIASLFTLWIQRDMQESPAALLQIIEAYRATPPYQSKHTILTRLEK